jgi:hypothetical protein
VLRRSPKETRWFIHAPISMASRVKMVPRACTTASVSSVPISGLRLSCLPESHLRSHRRTQPTTLLSHHAPTRLPPVSHDDPRLSLLLRSGYEHFTLSLLHNLALSVPQHHSLVISRHQLILDPRPCTSPTTSARVAHLLSFTHTTIALALHVDWPKYSVSTRPARPAPPARRKPARPGEQQQQQQWQTVTAPSQGRSQPPQCRPCLPE